MGWAHVMLWVGIGRYWWVWFGYGYKFEGNVGLYFTHKTESPLPLQFKHSHWWRRQSRSKFTSHYGRGTNGVCECKTDVNPTWIPTWHQLDHVSSSLGLFSNTTFWQRGLTHNDWETMALRTLAHNRWFIPFHHVWGPAWIEIHGYNIPLGWGLAGSVTYGFKLHLKDRDHTTWFWMCFGTACGHFLLGSHNHMVTAFDSCVKWPWTQYLGDFSALDQHP